jgi:hypothetical protein
MKKIALALVIAASVATVAMAECRVTEKTIVYTDADKFEALDQMFLRGGGISTHGESMLRRMLSEGSAISVDAGTPLKVVTRINEVCSVGVINGIRAIILNDDFACGYSSKKNTVKTTQLIEAARIGNLPAIKRMLNEGADVSVEDSDGNTALTWAAHRGDLKIVELLLDKGANVNGKNKEGATPLTKAVSSLDVTQALLDKGANVNDQSKLGYTALMWATMAGNIKVVKLLIDRGANVSTKNKKGETALMFASELGRSDLVKLLKNPVSSAEKMEVKLNEHTYACDNLKTSRELWVAAMMDYQDGSRNFDQMLSKYKKMGKVLEVPPNTPMTLTGRATGMSVEVIVDRIPGKWCVPAEQLKKAGITIPPLDYEYMNEQLF